MPQRCDRYIKTVTKSTHPAQEPGDSQAQLADRLDLGVVRFRDCRHVDVKTTSVFTLWTYETSSGSVERSSRCLLHSLKAQELEYKGQSRP